MEVFNASVSAGISTLVEKTRLSILLLKQLSATLFRVIAKNRPEADPMLI